MKIMENLAKDMRTAKFLKSNLAYLASTVLAAGVICGAVAIPEIINVRGREHVEKDGNRYLVEYDKRDNGVVLVSDNSMASIADLRTVDTNYDGIADYVDSLSGKLPVSAQEQKLFSEVTSNFYRIHPSKEALFK